MTKRKRVRAHTKADTETLAAVDRHAEAGGDFAVSEAGNVHAPAGHFAPEPPAAARYDGLVWIAEGSPDFEGGPPRARKLTWSASYSQWCESPW